MAALLPVRASWPSPLPGAIAPAATRSVRPVRAVMHVLPLRARGPLQPAPTIRMQARPRHNFFRSHCNKQGAADQYPEPEPEPERQEEVVDAPEAAESSDDPGKLLCDKLDKYREAIRAATGVRVAPDMFLKEKDQISNYMVEMSSLGADILNVNSTVLAQMVCSRTRTALDLASKVMDITGLGLYATEISQHTTNQMVRAYTSIICNVAEDAYLKRVKMETIISFLDALRGLGAICHILVEGTVAKVEDGPIKNSIISCMEKHSQEFDNKINKLKDEFALATQIHAHKIVTEILFNGTKHAESYVFRMIKCHKAALPHIGGISYP